MLRLSIVTINFNNLAGLQQTVFSVAEQTYSQVEHIVIDGASTDGSREFIEQRQQQFSYWVSEQDKGIYHAQNKGIQKATGNYILILNSGDFLASPDAVAQVMSRVKPGMQIVGCDMWTDNGKRRLLKRCPDALSTGFFLTHSIYHPSVLIAKEVHDRFGLYDERYRIVSDWAFLLLTAGIHACPYQHVPVVMSVFKEDGISSSDQYRSLQTAERQQVHQELLPGNLYREISALQFYLDNKAISFETFYQQQSKNRELFNRLKYQVRAKSALQGLLGILFSKTTLRFRLLALKIWFRKL